MDEKQLETILGQMKSSDSAGRYEAIRELSRWVHLAANDAAPAADSKNASKDDLDSWHAAVVALLNRPDISRALLQSLEDSSSQVRNFSAISVSQLTDVEAKASMIRHMLADSSPHVRTTCAGLLRINQDANTFRAFLTVVDDANPRVVEIACMQLRRNGDPAAIPALQGLLDHPNWEVRFEACHSLVELGCQDDAVIVTLRNLQCDPAAKEHDKLAKDFNRSEDDPILQVEHTPLVGELLSRAKAAES